MRTTLTFEHSYPVDPDRLFALTRDLDTLEAVTKPFVQFDHLPSGPVEAGQVVDVAVSIFGVFPGQPWRMRIVVCDAETRRLTSEEDGMGVDRLLHEIEVREDHEGARLVDRILIEAGWWLLPLAAGWAWIMYRWRHRARLRLLALR